MKLYETCCPSATELCISSVLCFLLPDGSLFEANLAGLGAAGETGSGYPVNTCGAPEVLLVTICDF